MSPSPRTSTNTSGKRARNMSSHGGHSDPCGGPYGYRACYLPTRAWHNGYRPKSPGKFSRLLPCLSTQSGPARLHRGAHLQAVPTGKGPQFSATSTAWHPALCTPAVGSEIPPAHTPKVSETMGLAGQSREEAVGARSVRIRKPQTSPQQVSPRDCPRHGLPSPFPRKAP